jgi:8-oxo-dGTP pyrophosphatase MutT (NUDIX family)
VTGPVVRPAGRVLLIDAGIRVLLLEHRTGPDVGDSVWAAPGGGCDPGEPPAAAARRELFEECGIAVSLDAGRAADHTERRSWNYDGVAYDQTDHYFIVRSSTQPPVVAEHRTPLEELTVLGHRWFSIEDLHSTTVRYEPAGLCVLLAALEDRGSR